MEGRIQFVRGDEVRIIAGKDRERPGKGVLKRGRINKVFPKTGRVTVSQMNMIKKHTRADSNRGQQGGIVDREASIHHSNLQLICPACHEPTRMRFGRDENGGRVRICKLCGTGLGEARE